MTPSDLGERSSRREARGDRDPQQVEHVRQLGLHHACSRARAAAKRVLGGEEAGDRGREEERRAETAGGERGDRKHGERW